MRATSGNLIEIEDLHFSYGTNEVLKGINLVVCLLYTSAGPWLRQGFTFLRTGPAGAGLIAVPRRRLSIVLC